MPDISKLEEAIEGLNNGVHPTLGVTIGSRKVTPGEYIPKQDTHTLPTLTAPPNLPSDSYTVVCLDLDAPFPSWNALSPALHWAQTGLQIELPNRELKSQDPVVAEYAGAGPPPGSSPHRYVILLYSQKPDSRVPTKQDSIGLLSRMRFDFDGLMNKLGLEKIEAVNHFTSN